MVTTLINASILDKGKENVSQLSILHIDQCKDWCKDACRELINKSMFDDSLWMLFTSLSLMIVFFIFNYNILQNEEVKSQLINRGYNIEKVRYQLNWIIFFAIGFSIAFLVRFLFFTNTIRPLG